MHAIRCMKTAEIVLEHDPGVVLHERKELRERVSHSSQSRQAYV